MRQIPILHSYAGRYGCHFERYGISANTSARRLTLSYGWLLVTSLFLCSATNKEKGSVRLLFQYQIKARGLKGEMTSRTRLIPCTMSKFSNINLPLLGHRNLFSQLGTVENKNLNTVGCSNLFVAPLRGLNLRTSGLYTASMTNDAAPDSTNDADWTRWKTRCWHANVLTVCKLYLP